MDNTFKGMRHDTIVKPVIVINAKTYPESTGMNVIRLIHDLDVVARETDAHIGLAVSEPDLLAARNEAKKVTVYAQHVDPGEAGRNTGFVLAANVAALGINNTILNHSEHKLPFDVLEKTIDACKELGMKIIICADTPEEAKKVAVLQPNYVAVEPPELIGGDISVSTAQPEIITEAVEAVEGVPLLVGAGIKNGADVRIALELGAVGVLVASGVVKAADPVAVVCDFLK